MELGHHTYAVILAGGEGIRFAPLSTPERPKQFLTIFDDRTLLQQTVDRLRGAIPNARLFVTTNARYDQLVHSQLPGIAGGNVILETAKRNTAPAIALAAHLLRARDPEAVMLVLPADHLIMDRQGLLEVVEAAIGLATRERALVTLGIHPTEAAMEYGYIERGALIEGVGRPSYRVQRFVEKPDPATAERFLASGHHYWNSGMFVWQAETILDEVHRYLPALAAALGRPDFFNRAETISIDYGVMERSDRAVVIPADLGWNDIGSWERLKALVAREGLDIHPDVKHYLDMVT